MPCVLRLKGPLDRQRAEDVINTIVRRHAALRAVFFESGAAAQQRMTELRSFGATGVFQPGLYRQRVIDGNASVILPLTDLTDCPSAERPSRVASHFADECSRELSPHEAPRLRASLFRLAEQEHLLLLLVDHLVADAWSMRIVRREFVQFYEEMGNQGGTSVSTCLPSYPEYALRQQEMEQTGGFAPALRYWQGIWSGFGADRISFEHLPFSAHIPADAGTTFSTLNCAFDAESSQRIRTFAQRARVTLYVFFLTIYCEVLQHYTRNGRLAIWAHFANRTISEFQPAIGWFANTHLIGLDLSEGTDLKDRMLVAKRAILQAYEHQEIPVALVWRSLGQYPRNPDAKLILDLSVLEEPGLAQQERSLQVAHAVDLTPSFGRFSNLGVYIRDELSQIGISVQYLAERFRSSAVQGLMDHFRHAVLSALKKS